MLSKLSCYQLKIGCYNKIFYIGFMVTTQEKPLEAKEKIRKKESKHTITKSHQITKEDNKK